MSISPLTPRERSVADLIAEGLTDKEIAAELSVSVKRVEQAGRMARIKLGVGRRDALRELIRSGRAGA